MMDDLISIKCNAFSNDYSILISVSFKNIYN